MRIGSSPNAMQMPDLRETEMKKAISFKYLVSGRCAAAVAALLLFACAQPAQPDSAAGKAEKLGFLVFGDTGYDYPFLDSDEYEEVLTPAEFIEHEREDWIEDGRPAAEYTPPPMYIYPKTGGALTASGLAGTSRAMADFCRTAGACRFAFMLGDNIYPRGATMGSDGIPDERRFEELFLKPFGKLGGADQDFRIYSVLGNHDWYTSRAGAMNQVSFMEQHPPFYMDGIRYRVSPPSGDGDVEVFAIDTYVMLAGANVLEARLNQDGGEMQHKVPKEFDEWARPSTPEERNMAQWLEEALRTSKAKWKFVIGHHPIWSSGGGKFEEARELRRLILPALCRYADAYFAGHDHTQEVHTDDCSGTGVAGAPPLLQVVSGTGAKQRGINSSFIRYQDRSYAQHKALFAQGMLWGFVHVSLQGDAGELTVQRTPDDNSGTHSEIFRHAFQRRSMLVQN